jgi:2-keto-3-deoxy-L-rhamnonate aldolase RhmA
LIKNVAPIGDPQIWLNPLAYTPVILRKLVGSGWRHLMVDLEHNFLSEEVLTQALTTIEAAGGSAIVRPPDLSRGPFRRCVEAGARRLLLPGVVHAEQVEELAAAAMEMGHVVELIPLLESEASLRNLRNFQTMQHVSTLHLGPYDLARDMQRNWRELAEMGAVLRDALASIRGIGKRSGCYVIPEWFDGFPFEHLDTVSVGIHELASPSRLKLPARFTNS